MLPEIFSTPTAGSTSLEAGGRRSACNPSGLTIHAKFRPLFRNGYRIR